jgi:hypothetical protein
MHESASLTFGKARSIGREKSAFGDDENSGTARTENESEK